MVATMCDGESLNRLVEGTEMASMISQAAPSQREGVRASLNLIADALRLLKTKEEAVRVSKKSKRAKRRTSFIRDISRKQSNVIWPEALCNSRSIDEFLWKGNSNPHLCSESAPGSSD